MTIQTPEDKEINKFSMEEAVRIASFQGSNLTYEQLFALATLIKIFVQSGKNPYKDEE